jgi:hypothetical protein
MSDNIFHDYRYHNPFFTGRDKKWDARRSYLFTTQRKSVPGWWSRVSIGFCLFGFFYGSYALTTYRHEKERARVVGFEYARKATPFLQAIEDRRYLVAVKRQKWLEEELFKHNPDELRALRRTYNDPTVWVGAGGQKADLHFAGIESSYKGLPRQKLDFLFGRDKFAQNVPQDHF